MEETVAWASAQGNDEIPPDIKHVDDGVMHFLTRAGVILAEAVDFLNKEATLKAVLQDSTAQYSHHIYQQAAMVLLRHVLGNML